MRKRLMVLIAVTLIQPACSYLKVEAEHVSHPTAGPPFGPRNQEDSINQINACLGSDDGQTYYESCLGYQVRDGGFYGPPLTFSARVGRRFNLKK
jgi:hypothetical protein